jgi:hypothetical protein
MQYMMLFYLTSRDVDSCSNEDDHAYWGAWRAYHQALVDSGVRVSGNPLELESMGTTVRVRDGQRQVQDGPYADTKEQLGGYVILELPSLDAALDWAARCPAATTGAVEIWPISDRLRQLVGQRD